MKKKSLTILALLLLLGGSVVALQTGTRTTNLNMFKPDVSSVNWGGEINLNFDTLDSVLSGTTGAFGLRPDTTDLDLGTSALRWDLFANNINFDNQLTSTIAIGTAPYVVTSTTIVANLNVDQVDGGDWGAPNAIGSGTPAAGTFTTLIANSASTLTGEVTFGSGGIAADGAGFKHTRIASGTTGGAIHDTASATWTFGTAFADTNYTIVCTIDNPTGVPLVASTDTKAAASINILIMAGSGAAASGTLNCLAVHD